MNKSLPPELEPDRALPGIRPLDPDDWLRVSDTYAGQMAERRARLMHRRQDVLFEDPGSAQAARELLDEVLRLLPGLGYGVTSERVVCPDGAEIVLGSDSPLALLGQIVQEDLCILQKQGDEHVLTGAILCFPAGWTLAEKAGRPLVRIHKPVGDYDTDVARRVQRLFDGVQSGRPLWRNNWLRYPVPDLWQAHTEDAPRDRPTPDTAPYIRAERQCILRLPRSRAVVFAIHTYVTRA